MADTGFVLCTSGSNETGIGTAAWSNPSRITADDGSYATADVPGTSGMSNYIRGSAYGFSIPGGSVINGIEARVSAFGDSALFSVLTNMVIGKDGSTLATAKADVSISATDANYTFGGASDLWGLSWTPAEINASTFLAQWAFRNTLDAINRLAYCDSIAIKVYYTPGSQKSRFYIIG